MNESASRDERRTLFYRVSRQWPSDMITVTVAREIMDTDKAKIEAALEDAGIDRTRYDIFEYNLAFLRFVFHDLTAATYFKLLFDDALDSDFQPARGDIS